MKDYEGRELLLIAAFLYIMTFPLLYTARLFDNNTLTSWKWVFSQDNFIYINLILFCGLILSYLVSALRIPDRFHPVLLLLLSFGAVIPMWQEPEVIIDASRYFLQAKHLGIYGAGSFFKEWGSGIFAWTDLPLVPLAYGLIFRYIGESRLYIQIFNSVLFAASVLLTYRIGKDFFDRETGIAGGLLLTGMPYLLTQAPLMLVDVPAMFIFLLAFYTFLKAASEGGPVMVLISSLCISLAVFSKYSVWLMLAVMPVAAVAAGIGNAKRTIFRSVIVCGISVVIAGALILLNYSVFQEQFRILGSFQWQGLKKWEEGFVSTFLFQIHPFIIILAAAGTVMAVIKKDRRFLIAGWAAFFITALQIRRIRYLIPLFPFIALMASYGLNIVKQKNIRLFFVVCIIAYSFVIAVFGYLPFLNRTSAVNLKDAGAYIDSLGGSNVEVFVLPQGSSTGSTLASLPLLDLFTKKMIIYRQTVEFEEDGEFRMKSPLRFTWEMKMPRFYTDNRNEYSIAAVISGESIERPLNSLDKDMHPHSRLRSFRTDNSAYLYRTFVSVYKRDEMSVKEQ